MPRTSLCVCVSYNINIKNSFFKNLIIYIFRVFQTLFNQTIFKPIYEPICEEAKKTWNFIFEVALINYHKLNFLRRSKAVETIVWIQISIQKRKWGKKLVILPNESAAEIIERLDRLQQQLSNSASGKFFTIFYFINLFILLIF